MASHRLELHCDIAANIFTMERRLITAGKLICISFAYVQITNGYPFLGDTSKTILSGTEASNSKLQNIVRSYTVIEEPKPTDTPTRCNLPDVLDSIDDLTFTNDEQPEYGQPSYGRPLYGHLLHGRLPHGRPSNGPPNRPLQKPDMPIKPIPIPPNYPVPVPLDVELVPQITSHSRPLSFQYSWKEDKASNPILLALNPLPRRDGPDAKSIPDSDVAEYTLKKDEGHICSCVVKGLGASDVDRITLVAQVNQDPLNSSSADTASPGVIAGNSTTHVLNLFLSDVSRWTLYHEDAEVGRCLCYADSQLVRSDTNVTASGKSTEDENSTIMIWLEPGIVITYIKDTHTGDTTSHTDYECTEADPPENEAYDSDSESSYAETTGGTNASSSLAVESTSEFQPTAGIKADSHRTLNVDVDSNSVGIKIPTTTPLIFNTDSVSYRDETTTEVITPEQNLLAEQFNGESNDVNAENSEPIVEMVTSSMTELAITAAVEAGEPKTDTAKPNQNFVDVQLNGEINDVNVQNSKPTEKITASSPVTELVTSIADAEAGKPKTEVPKPEQNLLEAQFTGASNNDNAQTDTSAAKKTVAGILTAKSMIGIGDLEKTELTVGVEGSTPESTSAGSTLPPAISDHLDSVDAARATLSITPEQVAAAEGRQSDSPTVENEDQSDIPANGDNINTNGVQLTTELSDLLPIFPDYVEPDWSSRSQHKDRPAEGNPSGRSTADVDPAAEWFDFQRTAVRVIPAIAIAQSPEPAPYEGGSRWLERQEMSPVRTIVAVPAEVPTYDMEFGAPAVGLNGAPADRVAQLPAYDSLDDVIDALQLHY